MENNINDQPAFTLTVGKLKSILDEYFQNQKSETPPPKEEEILLKRKDLAKLFGVSLVTINNWKKKGLLPFVRMNSRIFFKKSAVWAAMDNPKLRRYIKGGN